MKDLAAKSESTVRGAVDVLWQLARAGVDLGDAVPFLVEHQVRLGGFTDSSQALAAALLHRGDRAAIAAWIDDAEPKKRLCAFRGIRMAAKNGVDARIVLDDAALRAKLEALAKDPANKLPPLDV